MRTTTRHISGLLMIVLNFICINAASAQYNHAFPGAYMAGFSTYPLSANALDIVQADPGHQCVLGTIDNVSILFGVLPSDHFIHLRKIDLYDNTVWNHSYYFNDPFYKLEPWRLIKTQDEGFIVVGRARDITASPYTQFLSNPFAFKIDQNGLMQWAYIYHSNDLSYHDSIQTSVTRVVDDSLNAESYIITRSGAAVPYGEYQSDVTINALRIDVNGSLIWNRKYRLQNRGYNDSVAKDYPTTVTYAPDTNGNFYFIAGAAHILGTGAYYRDSSMFMIGIDKDGNIVRNYRWLHVPAYPSNVDAIYDNNPSENALVLSYTHSNSKLVDHSQTNNHSQIGLLKLDVSLTINMMKYYWSPAMFDNEAARISRNAFDDAYIVAANVRPSSSSNSNIAMLKVDKSGVPQFYHHYNRTRDAKAYGLVTDADMSSGSEYYGMVGYRASNTPPLTDMRVLSTDASGITCGSRSVTVIDSNYMDSMIARNYAPVDTDGSWQINIWEEFPYLDRYTCDSMAGDSFRQIQPGSEAQGLAVAGLNAYPTVLKSGAEGASITIELANVITGTALSAELFSMDGKLIAATTLEAKQKVRWSMPELAQGSYLLHVSHGERKVFRIVKL